MSFKKKFSEILKEERRVEGVKISDAGYELLLYIQNDGNLYKRRIIPISKNLKKKADKGVFDLTKSIKIWKPLATEGAKQYTKEFSSGDWKKIFDKKDIDAVAYLMAKNWIDEYHIGNVAEETDMMEAKYFSTLAVLSDSKKKNAFYDFLDDNNIDYKITMGGLQVKYPDSILKYKKELLKKFKVTISKVGD